MGFPPAGFPARIPARASHVATHPLIITPLCAVCGRTSCGNGRGGRTRGQVAGTPLCRRRPALSENVLLCVPRRQEAGGQTRSPRLFVAAGGREKLPHLGDGARAARRRRDAARKGL